MLRSTFRRLCQTTAQHHSSSVVGMVAAASSSSPSATAAEAHADASTTLNINNNTMSNAAPNIDHHVFVASNETTANATHSSSTASSTASSAVVNPLQKVLANAPTLMRNNYNGIRQTLRSGDTTATLPPLTSVIPFADAINTEKTKYVLLYFSASWCPPCRQFTPVLSDFYNKYKDAKNFEVVFCSWDQSDADFARYLKSHPDWLAINRSHVDALAAIYDIQTIPAVIIVDAVSGELITYKGRYGVSNDPTGKDFPWRNAEFPKHVNVNAPRNAMMIGAAATFGASLLLYLFAQDKDRSGVAGGNNSNSNNDDDNTLPVSIGRPASA